MKKIRLKYKNGYIENIEEDTTLYEIANEIKSEFKYQIVGAKLGEYLVDLDTKVTNNEEVEFYDISSKIGHDIYSRSLEFLLMVAFKKIIPKDADILEKK